MTYIFNISTHITRHPSSTGHTKTFYLFTFLSHFVLESFSLINILDTAESDILIG